MVYTSSPMGTAGAPQTMTQMFSSFLPKVEISKVILEYSDRGTVMTERDLEAIFDRNPHIDVTSTNYPNFDITTARGKAQAIESLGGSQATKIIVDLEIKVPQTRTAMVSVLDEDVIRQALEIHVWHTEDRAALEQLSSDILAKTVVNLSNNFIVPWSSLGKPIREIRQGGQKMNVYTHRLDLPIGNVGEVSSLGIISFARLNPANIGFAGDAQFLRSQETAIRNLNLVGPSDSLWVIEGGAVSSTTTEFVDPIGEIWEGPTHQHAGQWMTGAQHVEGEAVNLTLTTLKVPKVQDFRISKKIEALSLDFSITEDNIFPNLKKDLRRERIKINQPTANFSDIFLSRDIGNNCRFFFSIDWKRIILENSLFGKLFENADPEDLNALLAKSRITNFKVLRSRVDGSSEIGSTPYKKMKNASFDPVREPKTFEENQIPELIIESKDSSTERKLIDAKPDHWDSSFILAMVSTEQQGGLGASIEEKTNFGDSSLGIRHFTGTDAFIKQKTDGYYKYEVEVECIDKSVELVSRKYEILLQHIDKIKGYYKEATRLNRSPGVPPITSPYVDVSGEKDFEPGQIQTGAFNSKTNRFTREFINFYTDGRDLKAEIKATIDSTGLRPPPGFIQILKFFSKPDFEKNQITSALLDYLNPYSATPGSINIVLQLMETVASKISSILGVIEKQMVVGSIDQREGVVKKHIAAKNKTFKVKHGSSSFFNANLKQKLGFDFLDTTDLTHPWQLIGNNLGLYQINSDYVVAQAIAEKVKFFGENMNMIPLSGAGLVLSTPFRADETSGTYFTPRVIVLPSERIITHGRNFNSKKFLKVVSFSLLKREPFDWTEISRILRAPSFTQNETFRQWRASLANDLAEYFNRYYNSVVVNPDNIDAFSNRNAAWHKENHNAIFSTEMINEQHAFAGMYGPYIKMIDTANFGSTKGSKISNQHEDKRSNLAELYNLAEVNKGIGKKLRDAFEGDVPEDFLHNAPVQTKALLWKASPTNTVESESPVFVEVTSTHATEFDLGPAFEYTTQIINRIEVLVGYEREFTAEGVQTNKIMLNKPIWEPLNERGTNHLEALSAPRLCRSIPYINDNYLITRNENYNLPTYDEYFIMVP